MTKYLRIKSGEASFQLVERFDEVKKAADPNAQGEYVECKIENLKVDFTKVKKYKAESYSLFLEIARCREELMTAK